MKIIMSVNGNRIINDLIVPTILFVTAGFFGWAVRGTRGYGSIPGSTFAGACFAITWYFLSKHGSSDNSHRRYGLGWSVFGIIIGIGLNGMHGWMQYQQWVRGVFPMNPDPAISIDPSVGYMWWFIAAMPWAGIGAILVGWAGAKKRYSPVMWVLRISMGVAGTFVALLIRELAPQLVLPNYQTGLYTDISTCLGCREALEDTATALAFLGVFAGLLLFEVIQQYWTNVKLALIVGGTTALWWMLWQALNIQRAGWRYFEAMAGVGIGLGFGIAYYVCNKSVGNVDGTIGVTRYTNAERVVGVHLALAIALAYGAYQACWAVAWTITSVKPETILWLLIPIAAGSICIWMYAIARTLKHPASRCTGNDMRDDFDKLWLLAYSILRVCGFLVTFADGEWSVFSFEYAIDYAMLIVVDLVIIWAFKHPGKN
jgi:hypothetical protein